MKKPVKKTLLILITLVLVTTIVIISIRGWTQTILDILIDCDEKYEKERQSKDGKFKAIVFTEVCSHALIDDITSVAILPGDGDQKDWSEEDITFRIKGTQNINLIWSNENELNVQYEYTQKEYIYTKLKELDGIKVNYSIH